MDQTTPTPTEVDTLNQSARAMYRAMSADALPLAEEACRKAVAIDYRYGFVEGLLNHARALTLLGGYQEAIALMRHSLFLGEEYGFRLHIADCQQEIARAYYTLADYDTALMYWASCLDVAVVTDDYESYVRAQIGIGQVHYVHDEFNAAYMHHQKAREHLERVNDENLKAAILINTGLDLCQLGRYDDALSELQAGLSHARSMGNREYEAEAAGALGVVLLEIERLEEAESALLAAIELNRKLGNLWGESSNLLALGKLKIKHNESGVAVAHLKDALLQAQTISAPQLSFQIEEALSMAYESLGGYREALEHYKKFALMRVEILKQASPHKLQAIEMRLQIEKARIENADLRKAQATQRQALRRAERMASQDNLTAVHNRRGLEVTGMHLFKRAREQSQPLSALMIDVDHFKRVNDDYGHPVGDKVLRQIAALLKSGCRQDDIVARYGGEEFTIVLPGRDAAGASEVGERLRRLVEGYRWARVQDGMAITVSVGVAAVEPHMDFQALLERADRMLYRAKTEGRNRVAG
ncbi:hypothetical protein JCM19000A_18830 [Silvimonas sp. JCM 19000]